MKSGELIRLLKKDGWFVVRQTGSHIMEHPIRPGQLFALIMVATK
jgi:predicted RNA binding protein YcfA (HicA-like mRNA interferase family)